MQKITLTEYQLDIGIKYMVMGDLGFSTWEKTKVNNMKELDELWEKFLEDQRARFREDYSYEILEAKDEEELKEIMDDIEQAAKAPDDIETGKEMLKKGLTYLSKISDAKYNQIVKDLNKSPLKYKDDEYHIRHILHMLQRLPWLTSLKEKDGK